MTPRRLRVTSDRGFTLTELIIYVVLLAIVMTILVSVFISINTAQKTVTNVVGASNQGQAAANQISNAVNNASAVKLTVPKSGDQMLLTRTAKAGATLTWVCEAWYYESAANASNGVGSIRFTTSSLPIVAPVASVLATWTSIATAVTPASGSTIFATPVITGTSASVSFAFYATGTGQTSQLISTTATTPLGNTGSLPCF